MVNIEAVKNKKKNGTHIRITYSTQYKIYNTGTTYITKFKKIIERGIYEYYVDHYGSLQQNFHRTACLAEMLRNFTKMRFTKF